MEELSRYEYKKLVSDVADAVVAKLAKLHELTEQRPRYRTLKEAAAILNRSESWMRKHKDMFPHKKLGDGTRKGRLHFLEGPLYKYLQ